MYRSSFINHESDLVEQTMNAKGSRRERQMAYERILVELALHEHVAYVQLWPFIIGTLMRQVSSPSHERTLGTCLMS